MLWLFSNFRLRLGLRLGRLPSVSSLLFKQLSGFSSVDLHQLLLQSFYGLYLALEVHVSTKDRQALVQIELLRARGAALSDPFDLMRLNRNQEFSPHFPALEVIYGLGRELALNVQEAHPLVA